MDRISESVKKYMPFIELESFGSEKVSYTPGDEYKHKGMTKVQIIIEYSVPRLGIIKRGLEIVLYAAG